MAVRHRDPLARLRKGAGKGEGAAYVSPIHQRDFASTGKVTRAGGHRHKRIVQTLSGGEIRLFTQLDFYPGFIDVREQFIHDPIEETLTLCLDLGIKHPKQRGKLFPVSTDFLATKWDGSLLALEYKPRPIELLSERERQINLIREIWWQARGIPYRVIDATQISKLVSNNLGNILQGSWLYDRRIGIDPREFSQQVLRHHIKGAPLSETLTAIGSSFYPDRTAADLLSALYMAICCHLLTVDLRRQIAPLFPLDLVPSIDHSADWPWLK